MTVALGSADAERLRACVAGGGVALYPTDTVYGLCCDPDDEDAAARLYRLKGRPSARPAAVMFFALAPALAALGELHDSERAALRALLPGPLTLLLANRGRRFAAACRTDSATLGLRVPLLPASLQALAAIEAPVMQTSANHSGEPDARSLQDVPSALRDGVELVLDGGELPGTPSTVLDLREWDGERSWHVLREGAMTRTAVAAALDGVR